MAMDRMKRLKDLMDALVRQPPSPDRDRLLSEVRSRVVDLDTGVTPRAMLPLHEPPPVLAVPPRPAGAASAPKPRRPRPARPPRPAPTPASLREQPLPPAGLLTLEDTPLPATPLYGDPAAARPWTLGLRG